MGRVWAKGERQLQEKKRERACKRDGVTTAKTVKVASARASDNRDSGTRTVSSAGAHVVPPRWAPASFSPPRRYSHFWYSPLA